MCFLLHHPPVRKVTWLRTFSIPPCAMAITDVPYWNITLWPWCHLPNSWHHTYVNSKEFYWISEWIIPSYLYLQSCSVSLSSFSKFINSALKLLDDMILLRSPTSCLTTSCLLNCAWEHVSTYVGSYHVPACSKEFLNSLDFLLLSLCLICSWQFFSIPCFPTSVHCA